jgi:ubiquinone/menaquinone biosynthesis C-methylase UbiE
MKQVLRKLLKVNINEDARNQFLKTELAKIPIGRKILDAGAGELKNKPLCQHLEYVSQDICEYDGLGNAQGLHMGTWDTNGIDLVCDIVNIPVSNQSFDAIICSEVFEHLPDPVLAVKEFSRILKKGGTLVLTAPFDSLVHFAPYYYSTGFSEFWYKYHLQANGFLIEKIEANGDWFSLVRQEILRLPGMCLRYNRWLLPLAFFVSVTGFLLLSLFGSKSQTSSLACFGYFVVARKTT